MKKFLTKKKIIAVVVVLIGVAFLALRPRPDQVEGRKVRVERKDIVQTLSISGAVGAEKKATLNFLSAGKLAFVRVKVGDVVKRGDWLAGLDTGDLAAAERGAYYAYLAADANAKKVEDDLKNKDASESFAEKNTRIAAQTARDRAYDGWLVARRAVDNAVLKAPFDGVVVDVTVTTAGDTVGVTDGVVMVDPSTVSFETEVNETDISKVYVNQEAVVRLDAYPGQEFKGMISRIGYSTKIGDTGATVLPVWVSLPQDKMTVFRQGLNGDVVVELERKNATLVLPFEAVTDGKVITANNKEPREVKTGVEGDFDIEIVEGVVEGDVVIIN